MLLHGIVSDDAHAVDIQVQGSLSHPRWEVRLHDEHRDTFAGGFEFSGQWTDERVPELEKLLTSNGVEARLRWKANKLAISLQVLFAGMQ